MRRAVSRPVSLTTASGLPKPRKTPRELKNREWTQLMASSTGSRRRTGQAMSCWGKSRWCRVRAVCTISLGTPVVPEVYWIHSGSSAPHAAVGCGAAVRAAASSSSAPIRAAKRSRSPEPVTHSRAPESSAR